MVTSEWNILIVPSSCVMMTQGTQIEDISNKNGDHVLNGDWRTSFPCFPSRPGEPDFPSSPCSEHQESNQSWSFSLINHTFQITKILFWDGNNDRNLCLYAIYYTCTQVGFLKLGVSMLLYYLTPWQPSIFVYWDQLYGREQRGCGWSSTRCYWLTSVCSVALREWRPALVSFLPFSSSF